MKKKFPFFARATQSTQGYSIVNAAADTAEVFVYDAIGAYWGIDAEAFVKDFAGIKASNITLRINSPGGSVFDGMAMYNAIKAHPAKVTAVIDGLSASIASVIMLAADEVKAGTGAMVMVHNAWGVAGGNATEMREIAALLEKVDGQLNSIYVAKTGKTPEEIAALMDAETWFTAEEAVSAGLVDSLVDAPTTNAKAHFDLSVFKNTPQALLQPAKPTPEPAAAVPPEPEPATETQSLRDMCLNRLRLAQVE